MGRDSRRRGRPARPGDAPSGFSAVGKFALGGVVALAIVAVVSFLALREIGTGRAIGDAKQVTLIVGKGIVEPRLGRAVVQGRPAAIRRLDRIVRARVLRPPIVRVKVWTGGWAARLLRRAAPDRRSLSARPG